MTPFLYANEDDFVSLMPDRNAVAGSLQGKRESLNAEAHQLRDQRDRLNDETKRHSARRDELNAQVRGLVERANAHKAKRDANNQKVREAKARRDELNRDAHGKQEALTALRRERGGAGGDGGSLARMKAEVRRFEYEQQTTVLTPPKEKALIERIGALLKEIKEKETAYAQSADLNAAYEAMKDAKAKAEEQHALVTHLATEAQQEHDAMVKLFGEADGLRKEADAAQADFVKNKVEADRVHRAYIDAVTNVRDIDKVTFVLRGGGPGGGAREERAPSAAQRAEAEDIFEKFRRGEKLSTEDLIALQKGGRL